MAEDQRIVERQRVGRIGAELHNALGRSGEGGAPQQALVSAQRRQAGKSARFVDDAGGGRVARVAVRVIAAKGERTVEGDQRSVVGRVHKGREHALRLRAGIGHQGLQHELLSDGDARQVVALQVGSPQANAHIARFGALIVVLDQPGGRAVGDLGAHGVGEGDLELLVPFDVGVAEDRDVDRLLGLARLERHYAGRGLEVRARRGRAGKGRVVDRHGLAAGRRERHEERQGACAGVAFGRAGVSDRDRHAGGRVVVLDRAEGRAVLQRRAYDIR